MTKLLALGCVFLCAINGTGQQAAGAGGEAAIAPPAHHRMSVDVVVLDKAGKPVSGLEPTDFTLFDNNEPRRILAFRRTDGLAGSRVDPPVEAILMIDAVNLPYTAITLQRLEVEKFLRMNNGQLALPTSVFLFSSQGLHVQPAPSKDGNALAKILDQATGTVRARDITGGVYSLAEQFNDSFKTMKGIAENEARKPGRKVLIWIGPGWPLLTERYFMQTPESRKAYFEQMVALSKQLREARITIYNVAPIVGVTRELYKGYLKPVTDPKKMEIGDLALEVLAVETGGKVLDPSNDLAGLLLKAESEIGAYYTLTFEAPPAATANEYHSLKVEMSTPGLETRTNTGYYNQP